MINLPKRRDIIYSLICGEICSWFLIFIIKNPYVEEFSNLAKMGKLIWALPVLFPLIFVAGIFIGKIFDKYLKTLFQIVKFLEVGVLNTLLDIGILNLLVWIFGVTAGIRLIPFNMVAFLTAGTNSYCWNKFWTFQKDNKINPKEFLQFLIVSAIGLGINTSIVVLGTNYLTPLAGLSSGGWLNIMKILATFVSMVWNFLGYKFFVFKV